MQPVQIFNEGFIGARRKERQARRERLKKAEAKAAASSDVPDDASDDPDHSEAVHVEGRLAAKPAMGLSWVPPKKQGKSRGTVGPHPVAKDSQQTMLRGLQRRFAPEIKLAYAALIGVNIGVGALVVIVLIYGAVTGSLSQWIPNFS
jgi:hypothetical protein